MDRGNPWPFLGIIGTLTCVLLWTWQPVAAAAVALVILIGAPIAALRGIGDR